MLYSPIGIYIEQFKTWLKKPITVTMFGLYSYPFFLCFMVIAVLLITGYLSIAGNTRAEDIINGVVLFSVGFVIAVIAVKLPTKKDGE